MKHPIAAVALILMSFMLSPSAVAEQPPNVVLILSDDQTYTDFGFMGHDAIQTPSLDQLASQGVTFRRGYVPTVVGHVGHGAIRPPESDHR